MTTPNESSLQALRIDHIVLYVSDLAKAENFYVTLLNAHVERRLEQPKLVQLRVGESLLDLVPGLQPGTRENMAHYCFRVEPFDVEKITTQLKNVGVTPQKTKERYGADGYGMSMYLSDPDGNLVELKGPPTRSLNDPIPDKQKG